MSDTRIVKWVDGYGIEHSVSLSVDEHGHMHKGKGPGGGQFTSKGQGGSGSVSTQQTNSNQSNPSLDASKPRTGNNFPRMQSIATMGDNLTITGMDDDTVKRHLMDLSKVPVGIAKRMNKFGVKTTISKGAVSQIDPRLAGKQPRGWPKNRSWNDVAGVYDHVNKHVIAGTGLQGSDSLVLHEYGHGVDFMLMAEARLAGKVDAVYGQGIGGSRDPEFRRLHQSALKKLPPYLTQGGDVGPQETFAELFASTLKNEDNARSLYGNDLVNWMKVNVIEEHHKW